MTHALYGLHHIYNPETDTTSISWAYKDDPSLEYFILEVFDEKKRQWVPYDNHMGVIYKDSLFDMTVDTPPATSSGVPAAGARAPGPRAVPDTGWRDISTLLTPYPSGTWNTAQDVILVKRTGDRAYLFISRPGSGIHQEHTDGSAGGTQGRLPEGFRPKAQTGYMVYGAPGEQGGYTLSPSGDVIYGGSAIAPKQWKSSVMEYIPAGHFPTQVIGEPYA